MCKNNAEQKVDVRVSVRDRIEGVDEKLAASKQALREWVQEQNQKIDQEEDELRNKAEAVDVASVEDTAETLIGESDDAKLKELMSQADVLMAKCNVERNK